MAAMGLIINWYLATWRSCCFKLAGVGSCLESNRLKMSTSLACVWTLKELPFTLRHSINSAALVELMPSVMLTSNAHLDMGCQVLATCQQVSETQYAVVSCDKVAMRQNTSKDGKGWQINLGLYKGSIMCLEWMHKITLLCFSWNVTSITFQHSSNSIVLMSSMY